MFRRMRLSHLFQRFGRGDFHDPEMIHGADMPGLHVLVTRRDALLVRYEETDDGGEIRYTSNELDVVEALHAWFDAQLADHGAHAQPH